MLDGVIVGSVVREVPADSGRRARYAKLLENLSPDRHPRPFSEIEHAFPTLDAATA
ncbi:hypothetical protein [Methylobacterium sp. WL103]|uniref:hypothetical protein n=1 Tax=Methylobacterium sp. WL103 TaxID=2603891 RepID=UPI001FF01049|nr:hypothetical protein [Methylobacterium sp. WL103]